MITITKNVTHNSEYCEVASAKLTVRQEHIDNIKKAKEVLKENDGFSNIEVFGPWEYQLFDASLEWDEAEDEDELDWRAGASLLIVYSHTVYFKCINKYNEEEWFEIEIETEIQDLL